MNIHKSHIFIHIYFFKQKPKKKKSSKIKLKLTLLRWLAHRRHLLQLHIAIKLGLTARLHLVVIINSWHLIIVSVMNLVWKFSIRTVYGYYLCVHVTVYVYTGIIYRYAHVCANLRNLCVQEHCARECTVCPCNF